MTCAQFQDRLYDEDSRQAQRGQGLVPGDLAMHMNGCAACRRAYDEAREDERTLVRQFSLVPPAALRARILGRIHASHVPRATAWAQWLPVVSDSMTAGALAVALSRAILGPHPLAWHIAVFAAGGAFALFGPRLEVYARHLERSLDTYITRY